MKQESTNAAHLQSDKHLRETFNEDERNYDAARPGYPDALFAEIFSYLRAPAQGLRALEVGIGTGQATKPFLDAGCAVTAVELGDRLAAFAAEKYRAYPNFTVLCGDFLRVPDASDGLFDLLYAATAFHWLPKPEGYLRAGRLLRSGGVVALFWNHPYVRRADDPTNRAASDVYDRLRPDGRERPEFSEEMTAPILAELREAGFADAHAKLFRRVRTLNAEQYLALLNTYSDHRALDAALKTRFEQEMREAVSRGGGSIRIYDTVDLYLARMP